MTPKRLQRKRTAGYRLPDGAICVSRPSKFGNPFAVRERVRGVWVVVDTLDDEAPQPGFVRKDAAQSHSVGRFVDYMRTRFLPVEELRGHDLSCWCRLCYLHRHGKPLGVDCPDCAPCHADELLRASN